MPPKRASTSASSSAGSGSSSSGSSGSSSSSSGSSSSSSSNDDDSDDNDENNSSSSSSSSDGDSNSSLSQGSRKSGRSTRSRASGRSSRASSASSGPEKKRIGSRKGSGARKSKARSRSASTASDSDASPRKKSSSRKSKSSSQQQQQRKVAPKKSATAKPVPKSSAGGGGGGGREQQQHSQLSDNDSDSDLGDFSLSKFSARAKQAKKNAAAASTASSSSASNTPKPASSLTTTPAATATTASAGASSRTAAKAGGQQQQQQQASSKFKSIFSASSGSESDAGAGAGAGTGASKRKGSAPAAKRSPSPPKLTPQKSKSKGAGAGAKAAAGKKKKPPPKQTAAKRTTRSSSVSSEASSRSSSRLSKSSSDDDSDSSDDEVQFKKTTPPAPTRRKATAVATPGRKRAPATPASRRKKTAGQEAAAAAVRAATAAAAKKAAAKKAGGSAKKAAVLTESTDSEGDRKTSARPNTRQTRGGAPRRSKHITGRKVQTETDSEADDMDVKSGSASPRKKSAATGAASCANGASGPSVLIGGVSVSSASALPPVRRDLDGLPPIETRKCPVPGCDSTGHLGGRSDRHFLADACPVYHNSSRKECKDMRAELNKKMVVRKKALSVLATKSPQQTPTSEQKKHANKIKDARSTHSLSDLPSVEAPSSETPEDRQVVLTPFASTWDLKLFREAQAFASEDLEESLKGLPDTKTTRYIEMGKHEMEVWYQSPYPEDFTCLPRIYICEFCLKYMRSATVLQRHASKCVWKHPPGDEIYRRDKISVFEICGKRHKVYCQSLCLLAKFFLDHKTLYFDVEPFLFYVMTTADSEGCHIVGYFSKEKNSFQNYNVSCILTLPCYQRQGYGRLLIDFSYLLSRVEGKVGSPEKPLSDLGLITYRAYWKDIILEYMCNYPEKEISIKSFSEEMGINSYDIVSTLQYLGMIKYWKGQHVILKKEDLIEEYLRKTRNRPKGRQIYPNALKWKPYEPTAKERRQAEQIKKSQEERQKKR